MFVEILLAALEFFGVPVQIFDDYDGWKQDRSNNL